MSGPPKTAEERLKALTDSIRERAKDMQGRSYLTAVPAPPADAPAPPPPFQEAAEDREPGEDETP